MILIVLVFCGFIIGRIKTRNTITWWPYYLISKPCYKWGYRLTKNRFFALQVADIPGTILVLIFIGCQFTIQQGLISAFWHQLLTPIIYYLGKR